jgi:hypothetical protein
LGGVFQNQFKRIEHMRVEHLDVDCDEKWRVKGPGKPETCLRDGIQTLAREMDIGPHARRKASPTPLGADLRDDKRSVDPPASRGMLKDESQDIVGSPSCQ